MNTGSQRYRSKIASSSTLDLSAVEKQRGQRIPGARFHVHAPLEITYGQRTAWNNTKWAKRRVSREFAANRAKIAKERDQCRGTLDGRQVLNHSACESSSSCEGDSELRSRAVTYIGSILKFFVFGKSEWQDFCHRTTCLLKNVDFRRKMWATGVLPTVANDYFELDILISLLASI